MHRGLRARARGAWLHACSTSTPTRPQPQRLHARRRPAGDRRLDRGRSADRDRARRHARARGRASVHRCARRGADRVSEQARTASWPTTRRSRSATGWRVSWTCPCSCTGSWPSAEERRERAFFREGGVAGALRAHGGGRAGARLRPGPPAPDRGRGARDGAAAAGRVQRRARHRRTSRWRRRSRPRCARPAAACRACARSACMLGTRGVAQVSTNVHDPLRVPLADVVEAVRREAEPLGARCRRGRARRPRARRRRSTASPRTSSCAASTPRRHVLETRVRSPAV